ncbi:MAG TPA: hypothetical protein VNA12_02755, partial [Mycobacteriales bacterium]|nr:hypothetical protein [Mycobacteriales bacterium]
TAGAAARSAVVTDSVPAATVQADKPARSASRPASSGGARPRPAKRKGGRPGRPSGKKRR